MLSSRRRALSAAVGVAIDRAVGEPPDAWHPVAWFGRAMGALERSIYADSRGAGVAYTATGVAVGGITGSLLPTSLVVASAVAGRQLRRVAGEIMLALAADDLEQARTLVPSLVGRDPSELDESGLAAAVIESLAENTVDAVIAPLCWTVVAGGAGAAAYRAANTMDAMVGHRSARYEHFGWSAARLDDVANYVPARVTALLVAAARPARARVIRRAIREHAGAHPSPNAGVAEAAFAGALDLELGGPLRYGTRLEARPRLGWGPRPMGADIARAIALASHVELAMAGALGAWGLSGRSRR